MRAWKPEKPTPGLIYRAIVEPRNIGYVGALVEGHDGLAVLRTKNEKCGHVEFWVSPFQRADFEEFIGALGREIRIHVEPPMEPDAQSLDGQWVKIGKP